MAINITPNYQWSNEHNSLKRSVLRRYTIDNGTGTASWQTGLQGIQQMLKDVFDRNERVRTYGGKWSLSDVAVCNDNIHDGKPLVYYAPIGNSLITGTALYNDPKPLNERLFFIQSGAQIMQINRMLADKGLALPTTGASNGQTLAGAISTGTHGSAMRIGAMPDYVRAIHLVTSPTDHFVLQPSQPLLSDNFASALGAQPRSDDKLFQSALVSFGSFGIIHGYVIEAVSLYMLETSSVRRDYSEAAGLYPLLAAYDPNNDAPVVTFLQQKFGLSGTGTLHHVDMTLNPYSQSKNMFIRTMFNRPYDKAKLSPLDPSGSRVGDDILSLVGMISGIAGDYTPFITNTLFPQVASEQNGYIQTPGNTFGDSTIYHNSQGGTSIEFGVAISDAASAVSTVMQTMQTSKIPGVIGVRFVKPTSATVGFTRFAPLTCTIEIPAINIPAARDGYLDLCDALDNAGIVFTLHWGQEGDYSLARLKNMYGTKLDDWIAARNTLLPTSKQRYTFTNDFMKRCGLSEPPPLIPGAPIV
jgi:hypothetical protein